VLIASGFIVGESLVGVAMAGGDRRHRQPGCFGDCRRKLRGRGAVDYFGCVRGGGGVDVPAGAEIGGEGSKEVFFSVEKNQKTFFCASRTKWARLGKEMAKLR
jgi:hypothetical protein